MNNCKRAHHIGARKFRWVAPGFPAAPGYNEGQKGHPKRWPFAFLGPNLIVVCRIVVTVSRMASHRNEQGCSDPTAHKNLEFILAASGIKFFHVKVCPPPCQDRLEAALAVQKSLLVSE